MSLFEQGRFVFALVRAPEQGDGGARARPPDPENQKSRLPTRIHQNRGTMPQGKPEFRRNRFGSRGIEIAEAFAPMNFPGRVRQAALIGEALGHEVGK